MSHVQNAQPIAGSPTVTSAATRIATQPSALRAGGVVLTGSVIAALAILGVARLAGASMVVQPAGSPEMPIGVIPIVSALLVTIGLATVLLALISKGKPAAIRAKRWRVLAIIGLVFGVLSIAMVVTAATSTGTLIALSLMHLVTGVLWFVVLRRFAAAAAGSQD